ncbi:MAG: alpha/beta fold hydrolase [Defluviitaleaceae bacterium]|nr:alpha/beta fold hydrolase [Defluviitaleaceae bacterium]
MKKLFLYALALMFALAAACLGGCGDAAPARSTGWLEDEARAERFLELLSSGSYADARAGFDKAMQSALSERQLKSLWEGLVSAHGELVGFIDSSSFGHDGYEIVLSTARHENRGVVYRVVFSGDGRVAGFFIDELVDIYETSHYMIDEPEGFAEYPVVIGQGTDFPLKGILSVPDEFDGPLPAVVLVHGSGPGDMNLNAYGIAAFRDVAEYLSARGVAVLRYNKRTFEHGSKFSETFGNGFTVFEETIEDALRAKKLLEGDPRIDNEKIYVAGLSLGGMLAPRIASTGDFAGAIIMAGSPRSLIDIIRDQNVYFVGLQEIGEEERAAALDEAFEAIDRLAGERYYMEMDEKPAANYLTNTDTPFLIMQGSKDFQVYADVDYALYKEIAGDKNNFTFRLYDGLTHLFTRSTMEYPTTDDYIRGARVDEEPLADMLEWLNGGR